MSASLEAQGEDVVELVRLEHAIAARAERNENMVVGAAEAGARALGLEDADDGELHAADADVLADQSIGILDVRGASRRRRRARRRARDRCRRPT